MDQSYKGSLRLVRFIFRQDRFRIMYWLFGITVVTLLVPPAFQGLYGTQQERDVMAETMRNPAMTAMVGPGQLESYTIGAMTTHQMLLLTAVVVAIMNILLMVRHTRAEEEDGNTELVRALTVGRRSQLTAAMTVLVNVNVFLTLVIGIGLYSLSYKSMDLEGSFLYGAVLGGTGLFFAAAAAVCAQLSESARGATGLSLAVMIFAYLLRAAGDAGSGWLSWATPFGWVTKTQPYSIDDGWPLLLLIAGAVLLFITADWLNEKRDLGAGFIRSKAGKSHASPLLKTPLGLAWRIQRTSIIAWGAGMLVLGLSYGSVLGDLELFFEGNDLLENILVQNNESSLTEQFLPMLMAVLAFISTIPAILVIHRLIGEEKKRRIDMLLGRAVSRMRLLASFAALALITGLLMLFLSALGLWMAGVSMMEEPFSFITVMGASTVHFPAVAVMVSISTLLTGTAKNMTGFVWLYVLYSFIVLYLGGLFQFPQWMEKLSPFGYVPSLPIEEMSWTAMAGLVAIAVLLLATGLAGYRKRDIND